MPVTPATHDACIDALLQGRSASQQIELLRRALGVVWDRAAPTLGEVTLAAVGDRVLCVAREHHPALAGVVDVGAAGFRFERSGADGDQAPLRFVAVALLEVLGSLTAEILTPALHAELSRLTLEDHRDDGAGGACS